MAMSEERCDLYHEAIKLLAREAIGVFLFNPVQGTLYKEYVAGIPLTADGTLGVYNMMIQNEFYIKKH
jgi:ABC-type transport system substrate-binding protein